MSENKTKAVRWLEEFTCSRAETCTPASLTRMVADLGIEPEKARGLLAECEGRLVGMFLEWYNEEVTEESPPSTCYDLHPSPPSLTSRVVFKLGFAYGSFSVGAIDQGIHVVLPTIDELGDPENAAFEILFTEYFDKIPGDLAPESINAVYMGAIAAFAKAMHLDFERDEVIAAFEEVKEDA